MAFSSKGARASSRLTVLASDAQPASLEDTVDEAEFMMEDEEDDVTNVDAEGDDDVEENDTAEDNWLDEEDDVANGEEASAVPRCASTSAHRVFVFP